MATEVAAARRRRARPACGRAARGESAGGGRTEGLHQDEQLRLRDLASLELGDLGLALHGGPSSEWAGEGAI